MYLSDWKQEVEVVVGGACRESGLRIRTPEGRGCGVAGPQIFYRVTRSPLFYVLKPRPLMAPSQHLIGQRYLIKPAQRRV